VATLVMQSDLCKADEIEGACRSCHLTGRLGLGELSMYKGFEHVNDELARIEVPLMKGAPSEVDHRKTFPKCFLLENGKESVRNQGACSGCWAFAGASSAMNNLCTSSKDGDKALASDDDRFEVSVQQIMSCNDREEGCQQGEAKSVHSAVMNNGGLSKERDFPYMCGGGDSKKHFVEDSEACKAFPWGAQCATNSAVPGWMYGGTVVVKGESGMMALIAEGQSLYVALTCYWNLPDFKGDGVYQTQSSGVMGGHALTAIGYGNQAGTKYWLLQNSWGLGWGVDGYGKYLRGTNLGGIERTAYWVRAWVSGGKEPECRDGPETGVSSGGVGVPCTEAITGAFGNLCQRKDGYGDMVRTNCQKTCDSCITVGVDDDGAREPTPQPSPKPPAPAPPAPVAPTPPPAPAPTANYDPLTACGPDRPVSQTYMKCGKDIGRCNNHQFPGALYCNTWNGWCGNTDVHKNAQAGDEYDWDPTDCRPSSA